jgi:hypothetical protein
MFFLQGPDHCFPPFDSAPGWHALRRGVTFYFLKKLDPDAGRTQGYLDLVQARLSLFWALHCQRPKAIWILYRQDPSLFWALHCQRPRAILGFATCRAQG